MADEVEYTVFIAAEAGIVTMRIRSTTPPRLSDDWGNMIALGDAQVRFDKVIGIVPSAKLADSAIHVREG